MAAELLGHGGKVQRVQVQRQHRVAGQQGRIGLRLGHRANGALQCLHKGFGQGRVRAVRVHLIAVDGVPLPLQRVQRLAHGAGGGRAGIGQRALVQLGGVHAAGAVGQVVGLVHQHAHLPAVRHRQCIQHGGAVVEVVVVGHRHIAPVRHLLREVIGADAVRQCRGAHGGAIPQAGVLRQGLARGRQPVVKALCQRAGFTVAGLVGVFANLVAGQYVQHAQGWDLFGRSQLVVHTFQRVERECVARALGGQEEQFVQPLACAGLQQREQRAQRLADARGGLRQQAAAAVFVAILVVPVARPHVAVHSHGQLALPGAKAAVRKGQRRQRCIAGLAVLLLAVGPGQVARAQRLKVRLQIRSGVGFDQLGLLPRAGLHIDQRHLQAREPPRLAQQVAVHAGLGPVQGALVGAHPVELAPVGLDLFELLAGCVKPVGPPTHRELLEHATQRHLGLVAIAPAALHQAVAFHALQRAGRGSEAQVQVARAGREGAQGTHRHCQRGRGWKGCGHAAAVPMRGSMPGASRQRTWHTLAGRPWAWQYCSQRIWLSCSLSPGPLTSTSS